MMYQNSVLRALMLIRFDAYIAQIVARLFTKVTLLCHSANFERVTTDEADKGFFGSSVTNRCPTMVTA